MLSPWSGPNQSPTPGTKNYWPGASGCGRLLSVSHWSMAVGIILEASGPSQGPGGWAELKFRAGLKYRNKILFLYSQPRNRPRAEPYWGLSRLVETELSGNCLLLAYCLKIVIAGGMQYYRV